VKHTSLHADRSEFLDAQQDSVVLGDIVGAFIYLTGELESPYIA
jgi:hypothetical protein